jgi:xylan 1,4-beta-xylosidase
MALRADWQTQLSRCRRELGFQHVRFHGLLSDDMGTLICQNEQLLYSFFNADQIVDFLLSIGVRPFVELSFMPATLASGGTTVFRYRGNVTPPRDYAQWSTLIDKLVRHWVARYGIDEVRHWYFEVWNEPNLKDFWTGTQDDYFTLYRRTADTIKDVDASLRVGGPATAQTAWLPEFLEFCRKHDVPADFVSTHYYPTDAFGEIGADTLTQLDHAPRDVMRDRAKEARGYAGSRPLYFTEWNVSSNPRGPLHDQSFAAAYVTRILMDVSELVDGFSFWTFSDIFAENYFPSVPFHGGFGLLNLHGIPKPMYRAFELLHMLGHDKLCVTGNDESVNTWVVRKGDSATVVLTNHVPPRAATETKLVTVQLTHAPAPRTAYLERIDETHANPRRAWSEMGEPTYLSADQVNQLKAASRLTKEPISWKYDTPTIQFDLDVPPHAVAAITIEFGELSGQESTSNSRLTTLR